MAEAKRVSARYAQRATTQEDALLVCAYDDQAKCEDLRLPGSLTFPEFRQRMGDVAEDRELIFYCA